MPNTTVNKVEYGGQTVIDITDTTAETNEVLNGKVFYAKSGARSVGTLGAMTGATASTDGAAGLVPAPLTTDISYFLRGDGTWASADTWGGTTYTPYLYTTGSEYYVPVRTSMNGTSFSSTWVSSTPGSNKLAKYDNSSYLYSTTPTSSDDSTKVATTEFVKNVLPSTMTGATSSANGASGLVPAPTSSDVGKFLSADGTWGDGGKPMVILSYGSSTWNDFINAYNNRVIVYCRASSNSNPASGSQTRMAFMAYVNDATNPTNVEFQYYRSVNPNNKSVSAMCDEVYVYTLKNTGAWSVTVRAASVKQIVLNDGLDSTYDKNTGKLTMSLTDATTSAHGAMSAADKTALDALNTFFTASGLGIDSSGYITQTL